jgi:NAD(P)H-dependent FMN reductase
MEVTYIASVTKGNLAAGKADFKAPWPNQMGTPMTKPRIAIIISSTRPTRFGHKPAEWIHKIASARSDLTTEIIDLRDFPLPFFEEVASNAWAPTKNPVGQAWQKKIGQYDGYIFVSAEYNRSIPAVLKNALDYAYPEWNRKPAAYVGYGSVGGARAIEQLRLMSVELQMAPTRTGVHIQGADFMALVKGEKTFEDLAYLQQNASTMLDELVWWAKALTAARAPAQLAAAE